MQLLRDNLTLWTSDLQDGILFMMQAKSRMKSPKMSSTLNKVLSLQIQLPFLLISDS